MRFGKNTQVILLLVFVSLLISCGGAEDKKSKYILQGDTLLNEGNLEKARVAYKSALQIDPNDTRVLFSIGEVFEKLDNSQEAAKYFNRLLELDPSSMPAKLKLARYFLILRGADRAENYIKEILAVAPQNTEALSIKAGIFALRNDIEKSIDLSRTILISKPGDVDTSMLLASSYSKLGKPEMAEAVLRDSIKYHPDNVSMKIVLASTLDTQNKTDETLSILQNIVNKEPDIYPHYVRLANQLVKQNKSDEAEKVLEESLGRFPNLVDAKLTLLQLYMQTNGAKKAISHVKNFIKDEPKEFQLRMFLANIYISEKQIHEANLELQQIVDLDSDGVYGIKARNSLAFSHYKNKNYNAAEKLIDEILTLNNNDRSALQLRGMMYLDKSNSSAAIMDFRAVLRDQPTSLKTLKLLASAYQLNGDTELEIETLKQANEYYPKNSSVGFMLARALILSGKNDKAKDKLEYNLEHNPKHLASIDTLFNLYLKSKDWDSLGSFLTNVKKQTENIALANYYFGLMYQGKEDQSQARKYFKASLKESPTSGEPLTALIKSYISTKEIDLAIETVNSLLKNHGDNVVALNLKGELQMLNNNKKAAIKTLTSLTNSHPNQVVAFRNLANIYIHDKNTSKGREVLEKGVKANPNSELLVFGLATLYEKEGKIDQAINSYQNMLSKSPSNMSAVNNLAMLLSTYRNDKDSIQTAKSLINKLKSSHNPAFQDTIGWVYYKSGDLENAQGFIEKAIETAPESALLRYHLAKIQIDKGDSVNAKVNLKKAIDSKVEFKGLEDARQMLATL